MVLPGFDSDTGRLPEGEHPASGEEVVEHLGWNARRRRLLDGLADASDLLKAAGCRRIWLNGSFVTTKEEPGDFDACWDPEGVDLDRLDPIFFDFADRRSAQKQRFGGEFFPNVVEAASGLVFADFFQSERDTGRKGIIVLDIKEVAG